MTTKTLITYCQALELITNIASENEINNTETKQLSDAMGCILADDIYSPINVPSFNNSAMDGFAIQTKYVNKTIEKQGFVDLQVTGSIQAGDASDPKIDVREHITWEIMTGAPVPSVFDAVIQIENVEISKNTDNNSIRISEIVKKGRNIRRLGTDYQINQLVVNRHSNIQAQHIMALATVGISSMNIVPNIKVAILSTGNELAKKSANSLNSGKIFNSNQPYLHAYCQNINCDPVFVGHCKDNSDDFDKLIDEAQKHFVKIIFSTGAVSMGKYDFIPQTLLQRGAKVHFHKARIRPGKPILFAELANGIYYFGLPGNPIAAAAGMRFFMAPFIRTLLKLTPEKHLKAKLLNSVKKKQGFRTFAKAIASIDVQGQLCVDMLVDQGSYQSRSFAQSNCWLILPEERESLEKGEIIDIAPMLPNQMILQ